MPDASAPNGSIVLAKVDLHLNRTISTPGPPSIIEAVPL
jgi:hypothetical protein